MNSVRDGLIRLGFNRTMYAEDKQNSVEGVYDGIYKDTFISIEIFLNGYVMRVEEKEPSIVSSSSSCSPANEFSKSSSIRSESLTMQDIIHSLEKLTTQKVKEPHPPQGKTVYSNKI